MIFARRFFIHLFLFACLFSGTVFSQTATMRRTAIKAARLLDVGQGKLLENVVVIVENDKIVSVGRNTPIPKDAKIIDLGDATVLPGLIDAHTHITYHFDENGRYGETEDASPEITLKYARENARLTLEAGFTTIRNLAETGSGTDILLRDAINRGETIGPRMLVSSFPMMPEVLRALNLQGSRTEQIRQFVKSRIARGADVIKIFQSIDASSGKPVFSADEIRAAVEEAHKANRKVAVHAHEVAAVIAAVKGGCDSIEHGTFLNDEAIRLLAKTRTPLVPTVYLPTHYLENRKQFAFNSSAWTFFETMRARGTENLRQAHNRGVLIVMGSDAVAGLHGRNAREIVTLTKGGLKPIEAIRAATVNAAELVGLKGQIGEIKPEMQADIIAVAGNPLKDISALEKVDFVMKSGKVIKSK